MTTVSFQNAPKRARNRVELRMECPKHFATGGTTRTLRNELSHEFMINPNFRLKAFVAHEN